MTKLNPCFLLQKRSLFIAILAFSLTACSSFRKGYRAMIEGDIKEAKEIFEKIPDSSNPYGPGANFYYEALHINGDNEMPEWQRMHQSFCELEEEVKHLPEAQLRKLFKYKVTPGQIRKTTENLEARILEEMCVSGTIAELEALYDNFPCWNTEASRDSVRDIIVNKTIDPKIKVYEKKECREWEGSPLSRPTIEEVLTKKGMTCASLTLRKSWQISYADATVIAQRFDDAIMDASYAKFWNIQEHVWELFMIDSSFCQMPAFKLAHPRDFNARDCWFDQASDTLCLSLLRPLLAFHRNNPHTVLDIDICNQILCLSTTAEDASDLNPAERKQVEDVRMMLDLQDRIICPENIDARQLISDVAYLAKKYQHHRAVFDLALGVANYFFTVGQLAYAKEALATFQPLFPDLATCPTNFYFQTRKQEWFDNYAALLERVGDKIRLPEPMSSWNTEKNDEYALVSWGESDEVFFVRRNRTGGAAQIMTSKLEDTAWSKPVVVQELSVSDDIVPLSISAEGRLMVLKSGDRLWQSQRYNINSRWSKPDELPVSYPSGGRGVLLPDGSMLLQEHFTGQITALEQPEKDIFSSTQGKDGRYSRPEPLPNKINLLGSDEGAPLMALGNRMLFYTSDNNKGLGGSDMYSITLEKPGDWTTAGEPINLGLGINTVFDDNGLTFFSEYTGKGYFDRHDRCINNRDIWQIDLGGGIFPQNTMRFAGLVFDENRKPIGGGFMEFTTDYNLRAHSQPISSKGTYTYTGPDSSEVVRLFPEIPGYYSENDAQHFLANIPRGVIIRDTFFLTSFEYIRQNFKLKHSTFINGTADFDKPALAFPELTRFAKIATRMGAEIDLMGHTDDIGTERANYQLSLDRAETVKRFLVEKCGFDPRKIRVFGFGSEKPLCSNDTEDCRRLNRRIEVVFRMPELPSGKGGIEAGN